MNKPYLYKEYKRDLDTLKMSFKGWACGINGTSHHGLYRKKSDAELFNRQAIIKERYNRSN